MVKRFLVLLSILPLALSAQPRTESHLFNDAFHAVPDKESVFVPGGDWFPYPAYSDRKAWDKLTEPYAKQIRTTADKYLNYNWEPTRPSDCLKYEKTRNRKLSLAEEHNRQAIIALTMGELADGSGKYLSKIADGVWFMSQQYGWGHFQHTQYQASKRCLPTDEDHVISLHEANSAASLAITYHFFKEEFDKMDPMICRDLETAMEKHIFIPFFDEEKDMTSHRIWSGFSRLKGDYKRLNNWAPYCAHHCLTTFLLMDKDPDRLLAAIDRATKVMDFYMSDQKQDGACDEGPGYWGMSFGKVYDFAVTLRDASYGKANVLSAPIIRKMGEYKSKTYLDDGWVLGFGDCSPRDAGDGAYLFCFGRDAGSKELMNFGVYLLRVDRKKTFSKPKINFGQLSGTYRILELLKSFDDIKAYEHKVYDGTNKWEDAIYYLRSDVGSIFYPESEFAVLRKGDWVAGLKSSHNGESHNHNDVGSCILLNNGMPIIIDIGSGYYRKETFSKDRYKLWFNRSDWHATPSINGVLQKNGEQYASKNTSCNIRKGTFQTDIAGAYPKDAACNAWIRSYELSKKHFSVKDSYKLSKRVAADLINFPIHGEVLLPGESKDGIKAGKDEVLILTHNFSKTKKGIVTVKYSSNLTPYKELMDLKDEATLKRRVNSSYFTKLYFKSAEDAPLTGSYEVKFLPAK